MRIATFTAPNSTQLSLLVPALALLFRQVRPDGSTSTTVARLRSPTAPSSASHGPAWPRVGVVTPHIGREGREQARRAAA